MATILRNNYGITVNGKDLQYSGNVILDFGYDVQRSFPLPVTPYETLSNLSYEERASYIDALAMQVVADNQAFVDELQALVDSGSYRSSDNPVSSALPVNNLVDIDKMRTMMLQKLSDLCNYKIVNEFYSTAFGEEKRFDCNNTIEQPDQSNIMGNSVKAMAVLSGIAPDNIIRYKASGEPQCYDITPQMAVQLGMDMYSHITSKVEHYQALRAYINDEARTIPEILAAFWEMEI